MLNYIWAFMILIGVAYGSLTGNIAAVSNAALDSAKEAVTLCITMLGIMSMWTGLMEVARSAGLIDAAVRKCSRILHFLFPRIPRSHPAQEYIATNMIANILGLGWAATPAGLKAMEALAELEEERRGEKASGGKEYRLPHRNGMPRGTASNEMCTFLILNISSLQLIPVNMIAYRAQYGSANPAAIIGPGIAATALSTAAAIVFCKIMEHGKLLK